jgi:hypothetical protein
MMAIAYRRLGLLSVALLALMAAPNKSAAAMSLITPQAVAPAEHVSDGLVTEVRGGGGGFHGGGGGGFHGGGFHNGGFHAFYGGGFHHGFAHHHHRRFFVGGGYYPYYSAYDYPYYYHPRCRLVRTYYITACAASAGTAIGITGTTIIHRRHYHY